MSQSQVDRSQRQTRRERPKSAPYLRLKKFKEQLLETFRKKILQKKYLVENFAQYRKTQRSFRLIKRFLQT